MDRSKRRTDLGNGSWFDYYPHFYSPEEADRLFRELRDGTQWEQHHSDRAKTVPQPRLVKWYGDFAYAYSGTSHPPHAWTDTLLRMREVVERAVFGERCGRFQGALLNFYRHDRDSVGYHADDEQMILPDSPIASLSFGDERPFLIRPKDRKSEAPPQRLLLGHGSLLVMGGTMQRHWLHSVPKTSQRCDGRVNVTLREYNANAA